MRRRPGEKALPKWVVVSDAEAVERYDAWYDRHRWAYETEVRAISSVLPGTGLGLEVGLGTGRFAARLGIRLGVEPSPAMARVARDRGVEVCVGVGEALPVRDTTFERVLLVTALCFVEKPVRVVAEAARVLRPGGALVVADIDPDSFLGRAYDARRATSPSLKGARFHEADEIAGWMALAGLDRVEVHQTLFHLPEDVRSIEPVLPGRGRGGFVIVRAQRQALTPSPNPTSAPPPASPS